MVAAEHLSEAGFFLHVNNYVSRRMELSAGMYRKMDFVFFRLFDSLVMSDVIGADQNALFVRYSLYMLLSHRNNVKITLDVVKVLHRHVCRSLVDLKQSHILRTQGAENAICEIVSVLTSPERVNPGLKLACWRLINAMLNQNDRQCFCCGAICRLLGMDSAECNLVTVAAIRDITAMSEKTRQTFSYGEIDVLGLAASSLAIIASQRSTHSTHFFLDDAEKQRCVSAVRKVLPQISSGLVTVDARNSLAFLSQVLTAGSTER